MLKQTFLIDYSLLMRCDTCISLHVDHMQQISQMQSNTGTYIYKINDNYRDHVFLLGLKIIKLPNILKKPLKY